VRCLQLVIVDVETKLEVLMNKMEGHIDDIKTKIDRMSQRTLDTADRVQSVGEAGAKVDLTDICNYVQQSTIDEGNVERMTMLRDRYMTFLKDSEFEAKVDQPLWSQNKVLVA